MKTITGQFVDIRNRSIYSAELIISGHRIESINKITEAPNQYIMPGFIDAHIHIESSMLVPYEFARIALGHGTVATISDPHEIANVMGVEGVLYMIDNARDAQLKFHFGAPSCVPATSFETAGAVIDAEDIEQLMALDDIYYLSEMMNYPGVLHNDPKIYQKIKAAQKHNKPVDGHAPGLMGTDAEKYISAGISTDHECFMLKEALDKLSHGMKIIIREGSAAKNYDALHSLISDKAEHLMFCSDDKHPDDLMEGHINKLVQRSIKLGYDLYDVLQIACINPVEHYKMRSGTLRIGDPADFIIVSDLETFKVIDTYINGQSVFHKGHTTLLDKEHPIINQFNIHKIRKEDFKTPFSQLNFPVINAIDGSLITEKSNDKPSCIDGFLRSNIDQDILKVAVINRYQKAPIATAFIKNFDLTDGAIASTVAHDSHNIIAVGTTDEFLCRAVNLLINSKGGLSAVNGSIEQSIALPIAGLMSDTDALTIVKAYADIDAFVKNMGCALSAPYMTLSFMALLVIPKIKLSDKGLFDAELFEFF